MKRTENERFDRAMGLRIHLPTDSIDFNRTSVGH